MDQKSDDEVDNKNKTPENNDWISKIKSWIQKRLLSTSSNVAVTTVILLTTIWLAHRKRQKRKQVTAYSAAPVAINNENEWKSAKVAPLSVLLSSLERGDLKQVLLGTSRIIFQSSSSKNDTDEWNRVDLPTNEMLQKEILKNLSNSNADVSVLPETDYSQISTAVFAALPFVYLALVYKMMRNQLGDNNASKHTVSTTQSNTTFRDVAGLDSVLIEVSEIVQYLQHPERYQTLGAKAPSGVLLHGPPGTGKTLLAQAVVGEAGVDCFLACSASEFVEVFVGRGASRVRSLFQKARNTARRNYRQRQSFWGQVLQKNGLWSPITSEKKNSQCCSAILFIDELDALAKTRSSSLSSSNEEREQTLNQLLTEMDGFAGSSDGESDVTLIVMAASNRADVLDPAILRRFDRQIHVGYPDAKGREAILKVHSRKVAIDDNIDAVNWSTIAAKTDQLSGADLRNLVNEAALLAVREGKQVVSQRHLEHAARRIRQMKESLKANTENVLLSMLDPRSFRDIS